MSDSLILNYTKDEKSLRKLYDRVPIFADLYGNYYFSTGISDKNNDNYNDFITILMDFITQYESDLNNFEKKATEALNGVISEQSTKKDKRVALVKAEDFVRKELNKITLVNYYIFISELMFSFAHETKANNDELDLAKNSKTIKKAPDYLADKLLENIYSERDLFSLKKHTPITLKKVVYLATYFTYEYTDIIIRNIINSLNGDDKYKLRKHINFGYQFAAAIIVTGFYDIYHSIPEEDRFNILDKDDYMKYSDDHKDLIQDIVLSKIENHKSAKIGWNNPSKFWGDHTWKMSPEKDYKFNNLETYILQNNDADIDSPLPYNGKKIEAYGFMLQTIVSQAPDYERFIDVFGGSGTASVKISHEAGKTYIYNEKDDALFILMSFLHDFNLNQRSDTADFKRELNDIYTQSIDETILDNDFLKIIDDKRNMDCQSDYEIATKKLLNIINKVTRSPKKDSSKRVRIKTIIYNTLRNSDKFYNILSECKLFNEDYSYFFDKNKFTLKEDDIVYLDPPYLETVGYDTGQLQTSYEHKVLIQTIVNSGCSFIYSHRASLSKQGGNDNHTVMTNNMLTELTDLNNLKTVSKNFDLDKDYLESVKNYKNLYKFFSDISLNTWSRNNLFVVLPVISNISYSVENIKKYLKYLILRMRVSEIMITNIDMRNYLDDSNKPATYTKSMVSNKEWGSDTSRYYIGVLSLKEFFSIYDDCIKIIEQSIK